MKTIKTFFIATLLFSLSINAQITKGFWLMGGSGSFSYSHEKGTEPNLSTYSSYRINLEPNIGYFISNKLALGMKFGLLKIFDDNENYKPTYIIGPFARYYFLKEDKQLNIFIEPSLQRTLTPDNNYNRNTSTTNLKLGTVIFLNDNIGFETGLTYSKYSNDDGYRINSLALGFGLQIHLEKK